MPGCHTTFWPGAADAADKAKAEGLASLNLREKVKAFLGCLQPAYWQALLVVSLLYFARFDASFITLRARTVGCFANVDFAHSSAVFVTCSKTVFCCVISHASFVTLSVSTPADCSYKLALQYSRKRVARAGAVRQLYRQAQKCVQQRAGLK